MVKKMKALLESSDVGCDNCAQLRMMYDQAKNRISHLEKVVESISNGEVPKEVKVKKILTEEEKLQKKADKEQKKLLKEAEKQEAVIKEQELNNVKEENRKLKTELITRFGVNI